MSSTIGRALRTSDAGEDAGNLEAAIGGHPFVAGLQADVIHTLAANAMPVRYAAGDRIFRAGDPANRFYLIGRGKVAIESPRDTEKKVSLQTIGPGDVLGWSWLFPPYIWQFDARAVEPVEAIFFYGTRLLEQCEQDPRLGYELYKRMAAVVIQRLQAARRRLIESRGNR